MYHIFFLHSSVDGHLGCFHVLAIVNSIVMKIVCLSIFPEVGLLDHMVILFLVFWETYILFFIVAESTHSHFTSYLTFVIFGLFNDGSSYQCEVVLHFSSDLHFSNLMMVSIFSCACWPYVCLFWRNIY